MKEQLEVKALVMGGYNKATELLTGNREALERIAKALLERETLDLKEISAIIENKPLDPDDDKGVEEGIPLSTEDTLDKDGKPKPIGDEGLVGGMPDPSPA